ncbi:lamin tail domain-containing protein, partial [candidate division KSB1 bacterium]|nr:lamin tail domain-containing protein [candidate division KSB1 bacterium]NIS23517.1 lamin tail domain-containing protein [candidate division KSB1 bacterium]NIT70453.1 lamin tail domain-containing protein [candidate division KSB1 bacterium]NIU24141.1 lamin tail domain-containing protein [candidate division KSB1 bacterium]NIU93296.1 deoxyribonuclease [candidate division KSB1 bacterium]
ILISEIVVRRPESEFVEIFNPTNTDVSLTNYYLTDNFNISLGGVTDNAYTRIVKGPDSLIVNEQDFLVKFPDNAVIAPGQFQTVAFKADTFRLRYRVDPTYEIFETDTSVANMETIQLGSVSRDYLDDNEEAIVLFHWDGVSDLVEDVDYVL